MADLVKELKDQISNNLIEAWQSNDIIIWYEKFNKSDKIPQLLTLKGTNYKIDVLLMMLFEYEIIDLDFGKDSELLKFIVLLYSRLDCKLQDISNLSRGSADFRFSLENTLAFHLVTKYTNVYLILLDKINSYYGLYLLLEKFKFKDNLSAFLSQVSNIKSYMVVCYFCLYHNRRPIIMQSEIIMLFQTILLSNNKNLIIGFLSWWLTYPIRVESSLAELAQVLSTIYDKDIIGSCAMSFNYNAQYSNQFQLILNFLNLIENNNPKIRKLLTDKLHERRESEFTNLYIMIDRVLDDKILTRLFYTDFCGAEIYYLCDDIARLSAKLEEIQKHLEHMKICWFSSFIEWKSYFIFAMVEFLVSIAAYVHIKNNPLTNISKIQMQLLDISRMIQRDINKLSTTYDKDIFDAINNANLKII